MVKLSLVITQFLLRVLTLCTALMSNYPISISNYRVPFTFTVHSYVLFGYHLLDQNY